MPKASVTGQVCDRSKAFEVKINDKLIYSRLNDKAKNFLPNTKVSISKVLLYKLALLYNLAFII
jgi:hypothetical protein